MKLWHRTKDIDFIGRTWLWFAISGAIIVIAIVALFVRGLNFGIDFTGGTELDVKVKPGTTIETVRGAAASVGRGGAQIQSSGKDTYIIRVTKLDEESLAKLTEALKTQGGVAEVLGVNDVGPGWGGEVSRQATIALLVFLAAILIYISIRFEFKMAISSIVALFHDLIITVGVYALSGRQITPATVIAVLTILGYSLYDTIVIFDRIKENADLLTRQSRKTYSQVVNESINQVLARSINTSLTTLIPIVSILIFGGDSLKAFAFPLFVGILAGTYSSIFVASPFLAFWKEREPKFSAYREQAARRQTREARAGAEAPSKAAVVPKPKAEPPRPAARPSAKPAAVKSTKAPAAKRPQAPPVVPKPVPKEAPEASEAPAAPAARPAAARKAQTTKSQAKSRTKGPGSGKKKKKKR